MQPGPSQSELPLQGFALEVPRDGNAAWKNSSRTQRARLRASSHRQSRLLLLRAQASRWTASTKSGGRPSSGRLLPWPERGPPLPGSRRRGAAGVAAGVAAGGASQPRAQHPPGMPSERAGRKVQEQPGKVPPYARSGQSCVARGRVFKACSGRWSPFNPFAFLIYGEDDGYGSSLILHYWILQMI